MITRLCLISLLCLETEKTIFCKDINMLLNKFPLLTLRHLYVFSTLRNASMPTEVQITMNFREIEPMHKKRISEGDMMSYFDRFPSMLYDISKLQSY